MPTNAEPGPAFKDSYLGGASTARVSALPAAPQYFTDCLLVLQKLVCVRVHVCVQVYAQNK